MVNHLKNIRKEDVKVQSADIIVDEIFHLVQIIYLELLARTRRLYGKDA